MDAHLYLFGGYAYDLLFWQFLGANKPTKCDSRFYALSPYANIDKASGYHGLTRA